MFKKLLLTLSICFFVVAVGFATPATAELSKNTMEAVYDNDEKEFDTVVIPVEEVEVAQISQEDKAQNIKENDRYGFAITIMAMCIVLFALIVLSVFFLGFGKISSSMQSKKKLEAKGLTKETASDDHDVDTGDVIAAIALALSQHFDDTHDLEDTILTIRHMKRAYSPWNSKIYNMREVPELRRK